MILNMGLPIRPGQMELGPIVVDMLSDSEQQSLLKMIQEAPSRGAKQPMLLDSRVSSKFDNQENQHMPMEAQDYFQFNVAPPTANLPCAPPTNTVPIKQEPPSPGCSYDIKHKLKQSIVTSRKAQGKGDIQPIPDVKEEHPLTEAELAKREKRKEQNRRAATKCRVKKKQKQEKAREEVRAALRRKDFLENEVMSLKRTIGGLQSQLQHHVESGCCLLAHQPSMTVKNNLIPSRKSHSELLAQSLNPAHPAVPSPIPVKRNRPCDSQVVPSVSPNGASVETNPGIAYGCPDADVSLSHSYTVAENIDDFHQTTPLKQEIEMTSDNLTSPYAIAEKTHISPHYECCNEMPPADIPSSNNLPSWDISNLKPMDLEGFDQNAEPYRHVTNIIVLNNLTNMSNSNIPAGETTPCLQTEPALESLMNTCVSPNEVQPQGIRYGNASNALGTTNNFNNIMHVPQYLTADVRNNNNSSSSRDNSKCGYNANFEITPSNRGSYVGNLNTENYTEPVQPQQQFPSSPRFARGNNLLADFGSFRPSS